MKSPLAGSCSVEETPYSVEFFDVRTPGSLSSARAILPLVFDLIRPTSIVDVGCGAGAWLSVALEMGSTDITGIDGAHVAEASLKIPPQLFRAMDLENPISLGRSFDLAMCLEVAEHLPGSSAGSLISFLAQLAPVVLFSAAIPGQGGRQHVNEQWPDYWESLFAQRGFHRIDCIRGQVWNRLEVEPWYAQNCFLYVSDRATQLLSELRDKCLGVPAPIPAVHPAIYDAARDVQQLTPRPLLRLLGHSLRRTLSRRLKFLSRTRSDSVSSHT